MDHARSHHDLRRDRLVVGTRNILDAMHVEGVRRFIGMATPSLRDPRDERSLLGAVVPVPTGHVRAGFLGRDKIGASIPRADIARFLLDQVVDERFHRAAPAISG